MNNHDDLFRPENVDEQIEHLAHMQEPWRQSQTPGVPTIEALKNIYEEDEGILQRAWTRISSAQEATEASGRSVNAMNTPVHKGKKKMRTTEISPDINTLPIGMRPPRRFHQRLGSMIGIAAAVVIVLLNILAWRWLIPYAPQNLGPASGGPTVQQTPSCGLLPSRTNSASPTSSAGMTLYQSKEYALLYPQGWQGQADTQGSGTGSRFSNADAGTSMMIENAYSGGTSISPATIADGALPSRSPGVTVKNFHSMKISRTAAVGGVVWEQRAGIGDFTQNGNTVTTEQVVLVTNDPMSCSSSSALNILYQAPAASFNQINASAFQPMLLSFKFIKR